MITLYQTPAAWGVPNVSPFCIKLETYLRMAEIPYQAKLANPLKAPLGKIPFIEIDGQFVGDSQRILELLKRQFGDKVDGHLNAEERARGHLVRRTLEEATYFVLLHTRWSADSTWQIYKPVFLPMMPPVIGGLVLEVYRYQIRKAALGQGTTRHASEVIYDMGKADFDAVAAELGDKPFLFGERPTSFDATVYAFTAAFLSFPADSSIKRHVAAQTNLARHAERMQQRYFPKDFPPMKR